MGVALPQQYLDYGDLSLIGWFMHDEMPHPWVHGGHVLIWSTLYGVPGHDRKRSRYSILWSSLS